MTRKDRLTRAHDDATGSAPHSGRATEKFSFRADADLVAAITKRAEAEERSCAAIVKRAVRAYLAAPASA